MVTFWALPRRGIGGVLPLQTTRDPDILPGDLPYKRNIPKWSNRGQTLDFPSFFWCLLDFRDEEDDFYLRTAFKFYVLTCGGDGRFLLGRRKCVCVSICENSSSIRHDETRSGWWRFHDNGCEHGNLRCLVDVRLKRGLRWDANSGGEVSNVWGWSA